MEWCKEDILYHGEYGGGEHYYCTCLTLVSANTQNFTKRELADAESTRELHQKLGAPEYLTYFRILEKNILRNCPITIDDTKRALHIYSPKVATLNQT